MNLRKIASLALAVALQVLPITRVFLTSTATAGSSFAIVATWIAGALALLGGVDAVSGASTLSISPATATNGVAYNGILLYGGDYASMATSWQLEANWNGAQVGCASVYQIAPGLWLTNAARYFVRIGGTPTASGTFDFTMRVWDGTGCVGEESDKRSASITVTGDSAVAPTITSAPTNQTVTQGANVSFTLVASGTAPLSYQWWLNGAALGSATSATLSLTGVTTNQAGNYSAVVANSAGSVTSSVAKLTVLVPPSITTQPMSQTVTAEGNATFSVTATGTAPLSYQWRLNGVNLAGATGATLSLTGVTTNQAGNYDTLVSNSAGSVTSSPAILTVTNPIGPDTAPPTIFLQPMVMYVYTNVITLSGSAADDRGIANVEVQKDDGAFMVANGTTDWVATLALDPGTNVIRIKATDTSGNTSPIASSAIIFVVAAPLTLTINGNGVVAPLTNGQLLDVGSSYHITATANPGSAFNNWIVGGATSSSPTLIFTMSSNLTITANFLADGSSGLGGIYSGLFYPNTGESSFEHSGFFSLNVTAKGSFSGKLLLADATYPLKGQFDGARSAKLNIQSEAANGLQVDLQLTADSDQITGSVGDGSWQSELGGYRAVSKNSVNEFAGRYTILFSGEDNSGASPSGHGSATLTVDSRGRVVLKGVLADGSPLAQSVPVAANGQVPLFVRLPRGNGSTVRWLTKGSILGWLALTDSATNDTPGSLWWTQRAGVPGSLYPAGFSVKVLTLGSRYARPDKGTSSSSSAAVVSLNGGNLRSPSLHEALWSYPNRITVVSPNPISLTLTMSTSTGLLKGKFLHPVTGKLSAIRGVYLQKHNFGGGFFLGTDLSGAVMLEPAASVP